MKKLSLYVHPAASHAGRPSPFDGHAEVAVDPAEEKPRLSVCCFSRISSVNLEQVEQVSGQQVIMSSRYMSQQCLALEAHVPRKAPPVHRRWRQTSRSSQVVAAGGGGGGVVVVVVIGTGTGTGTGSGAGTGGGTGCGQVLAVTFDRGWQVWQDLSQVPGQSAASKSV